ncbi:sushi, von Willebrand factor type A, EGF and pentraxin domain-containing protein 1-like isoform X2 [Epinephelus moara]|uniref:sushi, von Willebrand factor type A, EGF and pentraxin domain-containing protein 1-like isoform X2 n=1 Tax=Epinephelus moara TaxID=300413 RepID=UPI00214ED3D8|nr:sushi, von Willebrand factor type A, EGF and pentraxin domain-containing protein 1-like isoform X2 [Epinephelus moara]
MRVFYLVWLFILWLNMDNSLQQSDKEIKCELTLPPLQGTRYEPAHRNVFSPGDTLRVICGQNYWISTPNDTSALTTCKEDGEWTVTPECQEVICSHPQDPLVNSWTVCLGQQIRLGETVSYTCKTGYKGTSGIPRATCTREGWKPNPFCQEIKCNRHDIQNAEIVSNIKEKYNFHEYASYVCKKGYQGHFTLTCTESGWTGYSQCTAQCPAIHVDNNVQVNGNLEEAIYGHVVRFSCKSRTEMLSGSPDMYCDENGEWNRPAPKCEAIICAVPNIENGYVPGNIQGYREHEVLHYECNAGYKRAEERPSKCTKLGIRPDPLCQEITCDRREYRNTEIVGSYKYEYRYNDQVQYICKNGHEGSFNLTCKEIGWIGSPDCTKRYCKKLHIDHADITRNEKETYSHNERVHYACTHEGGKVFTVTCEQSVWTGVQKCAAPTEEQ